MSMGRSNMPCSRT